MRVLMLIPPYLSGYMRNARWDAMTVSGSQYYPIYLAYATGLLEREKHEVKLLDAQVDGLTREQVYNIAREFQPELTAVYFSMKCMDNDIQIADEVCKITGSDAVLVGSATFFDPIKSLSLSPRINKLVKGEFDFPTLDLANKVPLKDIKSLMWIDDKGIHENEQRPLVTGEELDKFPFVTSIYKKHLNHKNYWLSGHTNPYIDFFTGRGCVWGNCIYCQWTHTMYNGSGEKYRTRNIKNVIEELRYIKEELPYVRDVYFQDDTLPSWRIKEISEGILENHLKIRWSCFTRPNLDYESMKLMKRAGCYFLEVGFESANNQILKAIKKGTTREIMQKFAEDTKRARLTVVGSFITGLPNETVDSIKDTTKWLSKIPILRYTITLPKVYYGTYFWSYLKEHGWLKDGKPNYPNLSTEEIYKWNKWSLRKAYLSWNFLWKTLRRPNDWLRIIKTAYYFLPYIYSRERKENKEMEW